MQAGVERSRAGKEKSLKVALRVVYASVWNLRAYEERTIFGIKHDEVKMALQVNPAFGNEEVNGVVVTRNIAQRSKLPGSGVYIESQRGDKYSVANPETGTHPEQVLVRYDAKDQSNVAKYTIHVFQRSNIANDGVTILRADNPKPVMSDAQLRELVYQSLKATVHFKGILGPETPDFSLDMEFKQDSYETGKSQLYIKQARPYLE
jgi:phosphoenolpyruvate synthase/pyruvate phosphate dikinase